MVNPFLRIFNGLNADRLPICFLIGNGDFFLLSQLFDQ